ncbi:MAG: DedA family protein [Candidatus Eisenbacteria bacterium]
MSLTEKIADIATAFIAAGHYPSVFLLMVGESMVLPIPSEAVMPFAGFLIAEGQMTFAGVILASTLGSIVGSLISYFMGALGGRPLVERWGKYLLLNHEDLVATERFFATWGSGAIFICRFIPVVRHLISLPAGFARMKLLPFCVYTIVGAGLWNAFLAWVGYSLRLRWDEVMKYSHTIDIVVVAILALGCAWFVGRHVLRRA